MRSIDEIIKEMSDVVADIPGAVKAQKAKGKKVIGVFPIYAPEELVYAAGMFPVGCWGGQVSLTEATKLLPPFACPVMQSITQLSMTGGYDLLDGAILSCPCDTLKCLTQNFQRTCPNIRAIFCTYPQNNKLEGAVTYVLEEFKSVARELEEISGNQITGLALYKSIEIYNENRKVMMEFCDILAKRPGVISAEARYTVMKARWFMDKAEHTALVRELCESLKTAPYQENADRKIVLAGIMTEPVEFVRLLDELGYSVVADEMAYESRQFRTLVPQAVDQFERLARQWQNIEGCSVVYDPEGKRTKRVVQMAQETGANGVLYCMMKFCEHEEFDYPMMRDAVRNLGLPILNIEMDTMSGSQEQNRTRLQAFGEQMEMMKEVL